MTSVSLLLLALASPVDFDTEIVPVLTRAGCNAGSCHGAAAGRGGFRLSLLGGDAAADHESIVHDLEGRRINLVRPEESLVLAKPTGGLAHKGGLRLEAGGPGAKRLAQWIAEGARRGKPRRLTHFAVAPVLPGRAGGVSPLLSAGNRGLTPPARLVLSATARFDDGKPEDVTAWTVFTTSDPAAIDLDDDARATVRRRGQHVVIARFLDRVVPVRLTVPLADRAVDLSGEARANFIDDEVYRTLETLRIPVAPRADDATFLRRVRLDLTGRLPARDEVEAFLKDTDKEKRARLIDRLLGSPDFVEYWTYRFAALFRVRGDPDAMQAYHRWIRTQVERNTPFTQVADALLTGVGDSHVEGPANFARVVADARGQAELVGQVFLGVRLQCANCHNHPLDRWTQDDYHGLAAVFARLERGRHVKVSGRGAVTNPRTGEPAVPRLPGGKYLEGEKDHRAEFTKWLVARDNPYFARAIVNRLWKAMFGRGLVDPEDDLRDTNPATHPELLERLAADFARHGYDVRHTLRLIARSETYNRSGITSLANEADDRFYSHAYRRALSAEVLADALADVTGVADQYGKLPVGTRAVALVDPRTPAVSLDVLGRCSRDAACGEGTTGGGLAGKLHQLNGELINRKVAAREGRLHKMLRAGKSNEEIVEEFYLLALGRRPSEKESKHWAGVASSERVEVLEDVVWALLNARDFAANR